MSDYKVIGPLAYRGKEGCQSMICTRFFSELGPDMTTCYGWHCSYCDEPCGSQGHSCDAGDHAVGRGSQAGE
jgi:hypothetical protein